MSNSTISELCNLTTLSWYLSDDVVKLKRSQEQILELELPHTAREVIPTSNLHDREQELKEITSASQVRYVPNVEEIASDKDRNALLGSIVEVIRNRQGIQQLIDDKCRVCILRLTKEIKEKTYSIDQLTSLHEDYDFSSSSAGHATVSGFNWKTKASIQWWKKKLHDSSQDHAHFLQDYTSKRERATSELRDAYNHQDLELSLHNSKQLEFYQKADELRKLKEEYRKNKDDLNFLHSVHSNLQEKEHSLKHFILRVFMNLWKCSCRGEESRRREDAHPHLRRMHQTLVAHQRPGEEEPSAHDSASDTFEILEPWRKNISQTDMELEGEAQDLSVRRELEMEHVYGFGGSKFSCRIFILSKENCVFYFVGATGVVLDYITNRQLVLQETNQRITCAALHPSGNIIATGHELNVDDEKPSIIIWTLLHDDQYSRRFIRVKEWSPIDRKIDAGQPVVVLALEFGRNGLDMIAVFLIAGFQYLVIFDLEQEPIGLKTFACLGVNKISSIAVHPHEDLIFVCGHNRLEQWTNFCTADSDLFMEVIDLELEILRHVHSVKEYEYTDVDIQPAYELLCDLVTLADDASQGNDFRSAVQAYILALKVTSYIKDFVIHADLLQWQKTLDTFKSLEQAFSFLCDQFKRKLQEKSFPRRGFSQNPYFRWSMNAIHRILHSYEDIHQQETIRMKLRDASARAFHIDECYKKNTLVCTQRYSEVVNGKSYWKWNDDFPLDGQIKMQTIFCVAVCGVDEFLTGMEDGNIYVWKGCQIVDICAMHKDSVIDMSLTWDSAMSDVHYLMSSGSDGSIVFSMWKRHEVEGKGVSFSVTKVHEQNIPRLYQSQVKQYGVAISNFPGVMKSTGFHFMDQTRNQSDKVASTVLIGTDQNILYRCRDRTRELILVMDSPSKESVLALSISPMDDTKFVSGSDDGVAALWNLADRKCMRRNKYKSSILSMCFSYDGLSCVIGLKDGNIVVIDVETFTDIQHVTSENDVSITSIFNGGMRLSLEGVTWTEYEKKLLNDINSRQIELKKLLDHEKRTRKDRKVADKTIVLQQEKLQHEILDLEAELHTHRTKRIRKGILHNDNKSSIKRRRLFIAEMDILKKNGLISEGQKKELLFEKQLSKKIESRQITHVNFKMESKMVEVDLEAEFSQKLLKGGKLTFQILSAALKCGKSVIGVKFAPNDQLLALSTGDHFVHIRRSHNLAEKFMKMSGSTASILYLDWSLDSNYVRANSASKELLFWGIHYNNHSPVSCTSRRGGEIPLDVKWASHSCTMEQSVLEIVNDEDTSNDRTTLQVDRSMLFKDTLSYSSGSDVIVCRFPCTSRDPHSMKYTCHTAQVSALSFVGNHLLTCSHGEGSVVQWKLVQKTIQSHRKISELPASSHKEEKQTTVSYDKQRLKVDDFEAFREDELDSEMFVYRGQSLRVHSLHGRRSHHSTNIFVVCTGEYLSIHRSTAVLSDKRNNSQRHFLEHGNDEIVSVDLDVQRQRVCTLSVRTKRTIIIWDVISLEVHKRVAIDSLFQVKIQEIQFLPKSCDVALLGRGKKSFVFILSYEREAVIGRFTFTEFLDHLVFDPFARVSSPEFVTFGIGLPDFVKMTRTGGDLSWNFSVRAGEAADHLSVPSMTAAAYVGYQRVVFGCELGNIYEFEFGRLMRVYHMHHCSISRIIVHNTFDQDSCILTCEGSGLSKIWNFQTKKVMRYFVPIVSDVVTLDVVAMAGEDSLDTLRHKLQFPTSAYGKPPAIKSKTFYFVCDGRQVHLSEEPNIFIEQVASLSVSLGDPQPSEEKHAAVGCSFDFFDQSVLIQPSCGSLFVMSSWDRFQLGYKVCEGVPRQHVVNVCCNPTSPWFLTATYHGFIQKWDSQRLTCVDFCHLHSSVTSADISPNGSHIAVAANKRCMILDADLKPIHQIDFLQRFTSLTCVRYSPDGNHLAVGTASGLIDIFDTHGHVAFKRWAEEIFKLSLDFDCIHWDFADGVLLATLIQTCCQPHAKSSNLKQLRKYALLTDRPPLRNAYANRPKLREQSILLVQEALEYAAESLEDIKYHIQENFSRSFPEASVRGAWKAELDEFLIRKLECIDRLAQFKAEELVGKVDARLLLQLFQCLKCIGTDDINQARGLADEAKKLAKETDKIQGELNICVHRCEVSMSRRKRFDEQVEALEAFKLRKTDQIGERIAELEETYAANVKQLEMLQRNLDGLRNEEARLLVELLKLNEPSHIYLGSCQDSSRADEAVLSLDWMKDNVSVQACHDRSLHVNLWNVKTLKLVRAADSDLADFHSHTSPIGPAVSSIQNSSSVKFKTMAMRGTKLAMADAEGRLMLTEFPVADHRGVWLVMTGEFERDIGYERVTNDFELGLIEDVAKLLHISSRRIKLWSHTSRQVFSLVFLQAVQQKDSEEEAESAMYLLSRLLTSVEDREVVDKLSFLRYCDHVEGPILVSSSMHGSMICSISFSAHPGTIVTAGASDGAITVWRHSGPQDDSEDRGTGLLKQSLRNLLLMESKRVVPAFRAIRDLLRAASQNPADQGMRRLRRAYDRLSVVEIKQMLADRNISVEGLFERNDLLERLLQVVRDPPTMSVSEMKFELRAAGVEVEQFFEREDLVAQILKLRADMPADDQLDEEYQGSAGEDDELGSLLVTIAQEIESSGESSPGRLLLAIHTLITCNQVELRRALHGDHAPDRTFLPLQAQDGGQVSIRESELVKGGRVYELVSKFLGTSLVPGEVYQVQGYGEMLLQYERYDARGSFSDRLVPVSLDRTHLKVVHITRSDLIRWGRVMNGSVERSVFRGAGPRMGGLEERRGGRVLATGFMFKTFVDSPRPVAKRMAEAVPTSWFEGCLQDYDYIPRKLLERYLLEARRPLEEICIQTRSKTEVCTLCDMIFGATPEGGDDRLRVQDLTHFFLEISNSRRTVEYKFRILRLTGGFRLGFVDALRSRRSNLLDRDWLHLKLSSYLVDQTFGMWKDGVLVSANRGCDVLEEDILSVELDPHAAVVTFLLMRGGAAMAIDRIEEAYGRLFIGLQLDNSGDAVELIV